MPVDVPSTPASLSLPRNAVKTSTSLSNHISVLPISAAAMPPDKPGPSKAEGLGANGAYFPDLFLASLEISAPSPRIRAPFLARLRPLICRSECKASIWDAHAWLKTSSTGNRDTV